MEMLAGASLVEQEVKDLAEFAAKTDGQEIIKIFSWVDFLFGNSSSKATILQIFGSSKFSLTKLFDYVIIWSSRLSNRFHQYSNIWFSCCLKALVTRILGLVWTAIFVPDSQIRFTK